MYCFMFHINIFLVLFSNDFNKIKKKFLLILILIIIEFLDFCMFWVV